MIIITNGTLMSIQNMTWNGQLGFQSKPSESLVIAAPDLQYQDVVAESGLGYYNGAQGVMGVQVSRPTRR